MSVCIPLLYVLCITCPANASASHLLLLMLSAVRHVIPVHSVATGISPNAADSIAGATGGRAWPF